MRLRTFAAAALAALAACTADNNTSVQWYGICYPPDDAACGFTGKCDKYFLGRAAIDTSVASEVVLFVEMHNQRPDNSDPSVGRLNTNDAYVENLDVTFTGPIALPGGTVPIGPITIPASGSQVVPVILSTAFTSLADGAIATAHVVAKGKYADESTFTTAVIDIPVQKCTACISYTCPSTGQTVVGYCPGPGQIPAGVVCQ